MDILRRTQIYRDDGPVCASPVLMTSPTAAPSAHATTAYPYRPSSLAWSIVLLVCLVVLLNAFRRIQELPPLVSVLFEVTKISSTEDPTDSMAQLRRRFSSILLREHLLPPLPMAKGVVGGFEALLDAPNGSLRAV
jgi:hypothetical protein